MKRERFLLRPMIQTIKKEPRLMFLESGKLVKGFVQDSFSSDEVTIYVFCETLPQLSGILIDRYDGCNYQIKEVNRHEDACGVYVLTTIPV